MNNMDNFWFKKKYTPQDLDKSDWRYGKTDIRDELPYLDIWIVDGGNTNTKLCVEAQNEYGLPRVSELFLDVENL